MTAPAFLPRQSVRLAARAIPRGSARARYEQEFVAEMYDMTRRRQRAYAISVLAHAWSLRAALAGGTTATEEITMNRKPLTCRLNVHHRWRWESTEDGGRFQLCARCGKDRTDFPEDGGPSLIGRGLPMAG